MVEFGGNNPGKNESPEEFNHRTSLKYNTFVLNDACKFPFCFTKMCGRQNPGKRTDLMKSSTIESFSNIASTCCMMRAKLWICSENVWQPQSRTKIGTPEHCNNRNSRTA